MHLRSLPLALFLCSSYKVDQVIPISILLTYTAGLLPKRCSAVSRRPFIKWKKKRTFEAIFKLPKKFNFKIIVKVTLSWMVHVQLDLRNLTLSAATLALHWSWWTHWFWRLDRLAECACSCMVFMKGKQNTESTLCTNKYWIASLSYGLSFKPT